MNDLPAATCNGLTFWPIPEFSDAVAAFGAHRSAFFRRHDCPTVPAKYEDAAQSLFFNGGQLSLGDDVDLKKAKRAINAWLSSFDPAHEAKITTVAYALWMWAPESKAARESVPA